MTTRGLQTLSPPHPTGAACGKKTVRGISGIPIHVIVTGHHWVPSGSFLSSQSWWGRLLAWNKRPEDTLLSSDPRQPHPCTATPSSFSIYVPRHLSPNFTPPYSPRMVLTAS